LPQFLWVLSQINLVTIVDVSIVTLIFYLILILIRGTRADQILGGIAFVLILNWIVGNFLHLTVLSWLVTNSIPALLVAIPVIFQPELRRLLEQLGRTSTIIQHSIPALSTPQPASTSALDEVVETAVRLSERRYGCLITIERTTGLAEYYGSHQNAEVTADLLLTIFYLGTPLHDGAVIIRGDHIVAARCYFPLSENMPEPEQVGTRHRAALGISEVNDSVSVVVSEETGTISVATNGHLQRNFDGERLRDVLYTLFNHSTTQSALTVGGDGMEGMDGVTDLPEMDGLAGDSDGALSTRDRRVFPRWRGFRRNDARHPMT